LTGKSGIKKGLIIAGHDPSAGAGLLMDIKVFSSLGIYAAAIPSAIVVENTDSVKGIIGIKTSVVAKQLKIMLEHSRFNGVKIGMLYSAGTVKLIGEIIEEYGLSNIVLDPILLSSSGAPLLQYDSMNAMLSLFPLCTIITPNIAEASKISGIDIHDKAGMLAAAGYFMDSGAGAVVIKGGHFVEKGLDLYRDGKQHVFLKGRDIHKDVHGTGCILSSAITSFLIKGHGRLGAVKLAKAFTERAIKNSRRLSPSLKRYVGMPG
jgi:hydroxymethylpyrimidine/phosphomethylpyrimidine kinase